MRLVTSHSEVPNSLQMHAELSYEGHTSGLGRLRSLGMYWVLMYLDRPEGSLRLSFLAIPKG